MNPVSCFFVLPGHRRQSITRIIHFAAHSGKYLEENGEENGDGSFDVIFGRQTASPKNGCQEWQPRLTPNDTR